MIFLVNILVVNIMLLEACRIQVSETARLSLTPATAVMCCISKQISLKMLKLLINGIKYYANPLFLINAN